MNISYDFSFPHAPCSILTVDTVDILGSHKISLEKGTQKERLAANAFKNLGIYHTVLIIMLIRIASPTSGNLPTHSWTT